MAQKDESGVVGEKQMPDVKQMKRQLDLFDQRLDNIDSVVTAVVERVMKQPVALNITCPHCGKSVEIAIVGNFKPTAK